MELLNPPEVSNYTKLDRHEAKTARHMGYVRLHPHQHDSARMLVFEVFACMDYYIAKVGVDSTQGEPHSFAKNLHEFKCDSLERLARYVRFIQKAYHLHICDSNIRTVNYFQDHNKVNDLNLEENVIYDTAGQPIAA